MDNNIFKTALLKLYPDHMTYLKTDQNHFDNFARGSHMDNFYKVLSKCAKRCRKGRQRGCNAVSSSRAPWARCGRYVNPVSGDGSGNTF